MAIEIHDAYMNVHQVAEYLHLNEKKSTNWSKSKAFPPPKSLANGYSLEAWLTAGSLSHLIAGLQPSTM